MNSDSYVILDEIAKRSGAIIKCPICFNYVKADGDSEAISMAYAMATNAWKNGDFRGASLEDVKAALGNTISSADDRCPSCDRD